MNEKEKLNQAQLQNDVQVKRQGEQKQAKKQQDDEAIQAFIGHVEKNDDNPSQC